MHVLIFAVVGVLLGYAVERLGLPVLPRRLLLSALSFLGLIVIVALNATFFPQMAVRSLGGGVFLLGLWCFRAWPRSADRAP